MTANYSPSSSLALSDRATSTQNRVRRWSAGSRRPIDLTPILLNVGQSASVLLAAMRRIAIGLAAILFSAVGLAACGQSSALSQSQQQTIVQCNKDIGLRTKTLTYPTPIRLSHGFVLSGYRYSPVPSSFEPRVSPKLAWKGFANEWETQAVYHVYLARFLDLNALLQHENGLPSQSVWVAVVSHDAYIESYPLPTPPLTAPPSPICAFGTVFTVVNATTGQEIVGGSTS
jgi:multidrug transporter EmrE-like cation transporter